MSRLDEARQAKIAKRQSLEAAGLNVHPYNFSKTHSVAQAVIALDTGVEIKTAGRITSLRTQGKVTFLNLTDETATIQVMLHVNKLGEETYAWINKLDPGDFLGVSGLVEASKTGETTIMAAHITILGKALRPLPSAWNAAADKEVRFRQRYVDLLVNPRANYIIRSRFTILRELRNYLQNEGYTEVDTPVLQPLYGGTNARPFTIHMNALDHDFYLRVAPELYLKRLIVGGFERIFEIAQNFRNEGIDQTHQPEFTMVEWYETYADYRRMMEIAEGLIKHLNQVVNQSDKLQVGEKEIELNKTWDIYTVYEALEKFVGIKVNETNDETLQDLLKAHDLKLIGNFSRGKAIFALFDKLVCEQLIEPTWIIDYPKEVSPLAKTHRDNPDLVERYELYIGGKEICDGWSEITDALDQRARFENEQQKMRDGDDEAQPLDEEFLTAMEYGLPPLGGLGMGIDRLVMLLTNEWSIRETIAFPTLRPIGNTADVANQLRENQEVNNLVEPVMKPNSGDEKVVFTESAAQVASDNPDLVNYGLNDEDLARASADFDLEKFPRAKAEEILRQHITDKGLLDHNLMVALALEGYAKKLGQNSELWYQAGLLHDADYEKWPEEHPLVAVKELAAAYPDIIKQAILSHGYGTKVGGYNALPPQNLLDKYITAVDELSGFLRAVAMARPNGFADMEVKSVKKKLKNKSFAAAIDRDDIDWGAKIIETPLEEHIAFMIGVFKEKLK